MNWDSETRWQVGRAWRLVVIVGFCLAIAVSGSTLGRDSTLAGSRWSGARTGTLGLGGCAKFIHCNGWQR
jgi:hypothetical protein